MEVASMEAKNGNDKRILARSLARELTAEEMSLIAGGIACTRSTCSGSDNNSCDLDNCGDLE